MGLKNKKAVVQPAGSIQGSEPILTIEQVAERLQLKPSTVYELTRRRNRRPLPVLRAGNFSAFVGRKSKPGWFNESRSRLFRLPVFHPVVHSEQPQKPPTESRGGRRPRSRWFCDSAKRRVPQSTRGRIQEVAVVAFARVLQDRVGAVSGVPAGACRALRVASPIQGAADLSWQVRAEDYSGGPHTSHG